MQGVQHAKVCSNLDLLVEVKILAPASFFDN